MARNNKAISTMKKEIQSLRDQKTNAIAERDEITAHLVRVGDQITALNLEITEIRDSLDSLELEV